MLRRADGEFRKRRSGKFRSKEGSPFKVTVYLGWPSNERPLSRPTILSGARATENFQPLHSLE